MKKLFLLPLIALALTACVHTSTPVPVVVPVSPTVTAVYGVLPESVQTVVQNSCGFLVDRQSIVNLAKKFLNVPNVVTQIANEICSVASPARQEAYLSFGRTRGRPAAMVVRGVRIKGQYVR